MKKLIVMLLCVIIAFLSFACADNRRIDWTASIMVNETIYYSTDRELAVEPDESEIRYTTSYAESGVPAKDGEANFGRETGVPYAVLDGGETVVVLIENEWIEFKPAE